MRVGAWQFDVRRGDVAANLASAERGLRAAAEAGLALVVLPEMWPTSFVETPDLRASDAAVERLRELSGELGLVACGSAFAAALGERPRNRLHAFDRGEAVLAYDKVHLFSPTAERELFSAGDEPPPTASASCGRLAGVVCYDLRFGPLCRAAHLAGLEVLVVPAQWPAPRASHWRALVAGRAVELQCVVVAANRTGRDEVGRRGRELAFPGNSLVVDGAGAVLAEGRGEEGLVAAEVDLEALRRLRREVPVARDARPELYGRWGGAPGPA